MANLAIVGSHSTNGVSAIHSQLLRTITVKDLAEIFPERFSNKTNGVTPRRWLLLANPELSQVITRAIGEGWVTDLSELQKLKALAGDQGFRDSVRKAKRDAKIRFATWLKSTAGQTVDPDSIFDCQIKRIHEYKRQLLHAMYVIHVYLCLIDDGVHPLVPRSHILAGKAAPGYWMAKLIIKLMNNLASIIDRDSRAAGWLKVVFLRDYRVSLAEKIIPAANLSEQISTAGMEASGTGNMKFAMNGALTIGTMDGANVEILEEVGRGNIYIFGLTADEIEARRKQYDPLSYYHDSADIRRVLDALRGNRFSPDEPGLFQPIVNSLLQQGDPYFHLADFESYLGAQRRVSGDFQDVTAWTSRTILNVARSGKFSSDRAVAEYARDIWGCSLPRATPAQSLV
jgi:starch phosphorylase